MSSNIKIRAHLMCNTMMNYHTSIRSLHLSLRHLLITHYVCCVYEAGRGRVWRAVIGAICVTRCCN